MPTTGLVESSFMDQNLLLAVLDVLHYQHVEKECLGHETKVESTYTVTFQILLDCVYKYAMYMLSLLSIHCVMLTLTPSRHTG